MIHKFTFAGDVSDVSKGHSISVWPQASTTLGFGRWGREPKFKAILGYEMWLPYLRLTKMG